MATASKLVLFVVVLLVATAVSGAPSTSGGAKKYKIGTTNGFKRAADALIGAINASVDPCVDFYEYACGNWVAAHPIPPDLTSFGHFTELREKVSKEVDALYASPVDTTKSRSIAGLKLIYRACMDTAAINEKKSTELITTLKSFGYWPMVWGEAVWRQATPRFDLTETLINIGQSRAIDVFVDINVGEDLKDVTRRLIYIDQGSLGLGSGARDYYLDEAKYAKQLSAYEKYIYEKVRLIAIDARQQISDKHLLEQVREIIDFEKKFAQILVPDEDRRNFTELYNPVRLSQMKDIFPLIDWTRYFRSLLPYDLHDYLNSDPWVVLSEFDYFNRLRALLDSTEPRVIANYVLLRYTGAWNMQLDERFEDIRQHFLRELVGKASRSPRWKECTAATTSMMQHASGALYIRNNFNRDSKTAVLSMIDDLFDAFNGMLHDNDWMDDVTRQRALGKSKQMLRLIGYPDWLLDDAALDEYYREFSVAPADSFAEIHAKHSRWVISHAYRKLLTPVDRAEFDFNAATVNAFYGPTKNAIMFPAAILQAPFFDKDYPKALNYGGIGSVIGHEITHGFDDQGSQYGPVGNLEGWWEEVTKKHFEDKKQCIIDQYSSYHLEDVGLNVNGKLTQGENIADNGGIKESFKAYRRYLETHGEEPRLPGLEHLTNHQLFFVGYAQSWCNTMRPEALIKQILTDPHSPTRFRVNGVVINQPEFAAAFNCPSGKPMNPSGRCIVW